MKIQSLDNLEKGAKGQYNGFMSAATARKCKKMINCFLISVKFQPKRTPTFVTLTLPSKQRHDDKELKRIFNEEFLKTTKRKFDCQHYFWRAEPQKNGNIHFHVIMDSFIHWAEIRNLWNNVMDRHGYIQEFRKSRLERFKKGFVVDPSIRNHPNRKKQYAAACRTIKQKGGKSISFEKWDEWKQKQAYNEGTKTNWSNPNSTDIHALRKIRNVGAYVTKYMTKTPEVELSEMMNLRQLIAKPELGMNVENLKAKLQKLESENRVIKGRIWGCSDSIRDLKYFEEMLEETAWVNDKETLVDVYPEMDDYITKLAADSNVKFRQVDDVVSLYLLDKGQENYLKKYAPEIHKDYHNFYKLQSKNLYS